MNTQTQISTPELINGLAYLDNNVILNVTPLDGGDILVITRSLTHFTVTVGDSNNNYKAWYDFPVLNGYDAMVAKVAELCR